LFYSLLADVVVGVHVLYVSFVVLGQILIWVGLPLRWRWVRNPWFRRFHLVMMTVVGVEAVFDITCPLTRWEADLRRLAGQAASAESFLGRMLHDLIFVNVSPNVLAGLHVTFAVVVLATFVLAPPRSFRRPRVAPTVSNSP
jgi:hypothetical protein